MSEQYIKRIRTDAGDLQIDYNELANKPTISNPNLLINSDFRNPVNQRGNTTYTANETKTHVYTIDRWRFKDTKNTLTVTVKENSVHISNVSSSEVLFQQCFEDVLPTGDYTASIKVTSITGNVRMFTQSYSEYLVSGINTYTWEDLANNNQFILAIGANSSIEIEYIKFEVGTIATAFSPRLYAEELVLCRRYYKKYRHTYLIGIGMVLTDGIVLPLPQQSMRIEAPKFTILEETKFNPTSNLTGTFINLTANYAVINDRTQFVVFQKGSSQQGDIGRIYGAFELDAEIY